MQDTHVVTPSPENQDDEPWLKGRDISLTYIIDKLEWGGAQTGTVRLLKQIPESIDTTLVTFYVGDAALRESIPDHINVVDLGIRRHSQVHKLGPLVRAVRDADVVVNSSWNSTATGTLAAKAFGTPVINWQHSIRFQSPIRNLTYRLFFSLSDVVLADSEPVHDNLRGRWFVPNDRVRTLRLAGIDTDEFALTRPHEERDPLRVGTIGRIVPEKGYESLVACARELGSDFEFHIVTSGDRDELVDLVGSLPSNVVFHGEVPNDEIPEFLNSVDIYFQPSRKEGLCITVLEAMACGRPVVASSVGGISRSVVHGETGYLTDPGSVEAYCEYLKTLASDVEIRREFGRAARRRIEDHYSERELEAGFKSVLAAVLDEEPPR